MNFNVIQVILIITEIKTLSYHCIFDRKYGNLYYFRCVPGVCNFFNPGTAFARGFDHPAADAANFNPNLVSCTNLMPASHPDSQVAGKPALGSKCSVEW